MSDSPSYPVAGGPGPSMPQPMHGYQTQQPMPYQPGHSVAPGMPVSSGLAMKSRNPFAVWLGLPIITLGIYGLVWYYKIHKEMAEFDRRRSIPVSGPVLVLIFLSWTLIAPIVSYHNTGQRVRDAQRSAGLAPSCSPTLSWLLMFAFGTNTLYLQSELNKIVARYAGAPTGTTVPLFV